MPGISVEMTHRHGRQGRSLRMIGRTRVSERVRAAIANVRATRGRRIIVSGSETSEDEYESEVSSAPWVGLVGQAVLWSLVVVYPFP